MSTHSKPQSSVRPSWPTGEAVKAFLRRHPAFLADDPDLLASLIPAGEQGGANVLDLQNFVIQRLQREIERLKSALAESDAARESASIAQARVHEAILALLGARNFEQFIELATGEVPGLLNLDALTFCLECPGEPLPRATFRGVHVLPEGAVDGLIGPDRDLIIESNGQPDERVFGADAAILRVQALLRLDLGEDGPAGLMALGSRFPDALDGEEAVELLRFLARVVEQCIRAWLELHG